MAKKKRIPAEQKPKTTITKDGKKLAVYHMGVSTHHNTGKKYNRYKVIKTGAIVHQVIKKNLPLRTKAASKKKSVTKVEPVTA